MERPGALPGHNIHGVDIETILLSVDEGLTAPDSIVMGGIEAWGFEQGGFDADATKTQHVRSGIFYFRGDEVWPDATVGDSDWLAIINGVPGSPSHQHWEIIHSAQDEDFEDIGGGPSAAALAVRAVIDSVLPAPPPLDYATWAGLQGFPPGEDGALDDPDRDGEDNVVEFYAGTDPLDAASAGILTAHGAGTGAEVVYRRAKNRAGVSCALERSITLEPADWGTYTPDPSDVSIIDCGDFEKVVVAIPLGTPREFFRLAVTLTAP